MSFTYRIILEEEKNHIFGQLFFSSGHSAAPPYLYQKFDSSPFLEGGKKL